MREGEKQLLELQRIVLDYFKDIDDVTMGKVIESFVYGVSTKDDKASKLIETFIKDNGIETAFVNYMIDLKAKADGKSLWLRSSYSERSIIEDIKISFLNLAFNRFIQSASKKVKLVEPNKVKFLGDNEDTALVHVVSELSDSFTLCGVSIYGDYTTDLEENVKGKITCKDCISVIKQGKSIKL